MALHRDLTRRLIYFWIVSLVLLSALPFGSLMEGMQSQCTQKLSSLPTVTHTHTIKKKTTTSKAAKPAGNKNN
jgi:hypothetical protein